MNVHGELRRAQLEQSVGDPADAISARIYADITDPAAVLPKFYNGTSWKTFSYTANSDSHTQNSGKSVTVDWTNGNTQTVDLTDNSVISFSNPVEGETYTLIINQNSTATLGDGNLYNFILNMADLETNGKPYQPECVIPLGKQRVYRFLYQAGITPAVTNVPAQSWTIANFTATAHYGASFSRDGKMWSAGRGTTPYVDHSPVFITSPTQQNPLSYCNLLSTTASAGTINTIAFHPSKPVMFQSGQTSPYIQAFHLNNTAPTTAAANPGTLPAGAGRSVDVHPSGNYVAVAHDTSPFMSVYPFDGNAFGTKLSNPSSLPATGTVSVQFSPSGDYLAISSNFSSPYLAVYAFSDAAGTGTIGAKSAEPSSPPSASVGATYGSKSLSWRPQGDFIAMGLFASPYLYVVQFNRTTGAFGNSLSVAGAGIVATINSTAWTPDGQYLVVAGVNSGGSATLYVIDFSNQTIGASVTFDGGILSGVQINSVSICPNGEYMVISYDASPWSAVLSLPKKARNYLLLDT
jgi:hypothetical protein